MDNPKNQKKIIIESSCVLMVTISPVPPTYNLLKITPKNIEENMYLRTESKSQYYKAENYRSFLFG